MHEDRSSCMYYLICDLMQLHVLYYMHQVDMHHLDLHVLPKPKRVSGASTRYETVRYP